MAVPGGEVFVRQWDPGPGGKLPFVLLHDSLGSVEQWRAFPDALATATSRRVVAYDRVGFGRSSPRTDPPSAGFIDDEAKLSFPAVARELALHGYVLFGHSVGGAMALTIAAHQPDSCHAVITESAQAFVAERTLAGIRAAKEGFRDAAQFSKLTRWHGERARWVLEAWTEAWLSPAFRTWSLDDRLGKIQCPVLAIHGDTDEYGSCDFPRRIATGVRGPAQMEILAACGHVPHREKEGEVLRLVRAFLEEHAIR
ncbi:MAG TPA: alpha/beta hydrolase [Thermoanaerobaculia bacterium]|nr:alpha/beta hydrolase [Thermoanaerobaculia bacterium]